MPDSAFAKAPPSPNVDDRREEFSALQHLAYALGLAPVDNTEHGRMGWEAGMWFDPEADPSVPLAPPTKLGAALGGADLDNQHQFARLLSGKTPISSTKGPR